MKLIIFLLCVLTCFVGAAAQDTMEAAAVEENTDDVVASSDDRPDNVEETVEASSPSGVQEQAPAEESNDESSGDTAEDTAGSDRLAQVGPFIDLLGPSLLSIEMTGPTTAQLSDFPTNEALHGKKVVGLYFSADWCGPCRQFTPELVKFYEKVNKRRRDDFEIVWISRCRDVQSYGQYFTEMKWLALPPQEAMGERGQWLGEKYGVKSIPSLVLLDDSGNIITKDARNQIPKDKAGIGFPWRNPLVSLYMTLFPKTLRHMIKSSIASTGGQLVKRLQAVLRPSRRAAA